METIKSWITRFTRSKVNRNTTQSETASRDYDKERASGRSDSMSSDDQAWEAETRKRDHDAHPPGKAPSARE